MRYLANRSGSVAAPEAKFARRLLTRGFGGSDFRSGIVKELLEPIIGVRKVNRNRDGFQTSGIVTHQKPIAFFELERLPKHLFGHAECLRDDFTIRLARHLTHEIRVRLCHDAGIEVSYTLCSDPYSESELSSSSREGHCNIPRFHVRVLCLLRYEFISLIKHKTHQRSDLSRSSAAFICEISEHPCKMPEHVRIMRLHNVQPRRWDVVQLSN